MTYEKAMILVTVLLGALAICLAIFATTTPEDEKDFMDACEKWRGGRL